MSTSQSLGQFIRLRRNELGLTQEQLAEQIGEGVRQSEVSRLEHDRVSLPRRERMEQLAAALEVSMGELLARSGWIAEDDDLAREPDAHAFVEGEPARREPISREDVAALVATVAAAQTLIGTAIEALTMADEALRTTVQVLNGAGGRGSIRPPIGVIRRWESSAVVA